MQSTCPSFFLRFIAPAFLLSAGLPSLHAEKLVDPVYKDNRGVAIRGYDPVAYFKEAKPVKGSAQFSHAWMGATWQFANDANRALFAADPEKYAPRFGGYCAFAVSKNQTAEIDPEAWKIIDGRLYLNYSKAVQKKWEDDVMTRIEAATKNWPALHK